jgi:hypothetical protein
VNETNIYTKAYEEFITSLDMKMRDAVTKLMIHTKTRPDDPQMVGVCLTSIATKNNSQTQERVLEAQQTTLEILNKLKKDPELARGLGMVETLTQSLDQCEYVIRHSVKIWGVGAGFFACIWFSTMVFAWNTAYDLAQKNMQVRIHEQVCNDLYGEIASVSEYLRKSLHMSAAADRLATANLTLCPR